MISIPNDILTKYGILPFEEYSQQWVEIKDEDERIKLFCNLFLSETDHIPNKIIEQLIENLADASALDFISVFIKFIADVRVNYNDILKYRKSAREEINRIESESSEVTE